MKKALRYVLPFALLVCAFAIRAEEVYFISSNETTYVNEDVVCVGDVIVMYCGKILSADKISYNRKNDLISAEGNVIIKDEKQNVYFMDSVSVERNFENGEGKNIKIIMSDKSRFAAAKVVIKNKKFELTNVVYTPCYECTASDACTWKIRSRNVVFDPNESVRYSDSRFDVLGKNILYLPYLSHPSPKIARKTGFLAPTVFLSQKNGFCVMPKYLFAISEHQELILKPVITTRVGPIGWVYYGSRFKNGEFSVDASITGIQSATTRNTDPESQRLVEDIRRSGYRGHIFSKLRYEIDDTWRCGFDVNLSTDRSYLRRFSFFGAPKRILESKIFLEGFDDRNYTSVKATMFQGLDFEELPKVLPIIERNYSTHLFGGTFDIDTMFLKFNFRGEKDVKSTQKLSSNISWKKSFMLPYGSIFNFKGLLSLRVANVEAVKASNHKSRAYAVPQISASWEWPFLFTNDACSTIITPIIGLIYASNKKYFDGLEELSCEINDINIIEGSRAISPHDIDYGNRVCYALRASSYINGKNVSQFIIGRSTELLPAERKSKSGTGTTSSKLKHSNIATSLDVFLNKNVTFLAKGSYSRQEKKWLKFVSGLRFVYKKIDADILAFNGQHDYFDPFARCMYQAVESRARHPYKGYMVDIGWQTTKKIKLKAGVVFDNVHNKIVKHNVGMIFKNECVDLELSLEKTNYQQGDLKPDTVIKLTAQLKNLGATR